MLLKHGKIADFVVKGKYLHLAEYAGNRQIYAPVPAKVAGSLSYVSGAVRAVVVFRQRLFFLPLCYVFNRGVKMNFYLIFALV